jgi:UDP-glucose 4-epimerase
MTNGLSIGVIGSNGFIGSHLVRELLNFNNINNLSLFGRSENSVIEFSNPKIEYYQIDLKDNQSYINKLKNLDLIFYLASETIPSNSWNNPMIEFSDNIIPFIEFLETIKNTRIKKIIYSSSAGTIYGPSLKKLSEKSITAPFSPYGIGKLAMEHFLEYYRVNYNINYDIYRLSNVYGPNQDTSKGLGLINTIIENMISEKETTIFGNGKNLRNYIYIQDVVDVLINSINFSLFESNVLNVASNQNYNINQIIKIIEKVTNKKLTIKYLNQRSSDNPNIQISNKNLLRKIPSINITSIEEGIKLTYEHIKAMKKYEKRTKI